ncbi:MAG TPA: PDZ domain-containing protein [Candidatus Limnocylindria bacterium]|nr:PDZ domain-containing protein [Candidatus Limnocylindria bacterium]
MNLPFSLRFILPLLAAALGTRAADLYVGVEGQDANVGTKSSPFATLEAAQRAAQKVASREPVTVHVAPGVYYLSKTLVFTAADSGSEANPVTYQADSGGEVVISGGTRLTVEWKPYQAGIFQAAVPAGLDIDQLWINGERQWMARFPNRESGDGLNVFDTWKLDHNGKADPSRDPLNPARVARWSNPAGGYFHALHPALWGGVQWRITGKKPDGTLAMEGGTQNNRGSAIHPLYRMIENIFEELDAPGEWFHDRSASVLYYYPRPGVDLKHAIVEIVRLRHLVECQGSQTAPVRFLSFQGFTFRHTARTFMDTKEPLLRSDWTTYRGGAVLFVGTEDCQVRDCRFDQVGGNTIFVSGYNRRTTIAGCRIENSGANGIAFVGKVSAVRSPLLNYDAPFDYAKVDRTPGPQSDEYPADCLVEECLITRIGRVEKQTAGVEIAMARDITVRHCSIYDVPRAGINIGDGCWGGHVIEYCDVFDTVQETGDHGSFNSWGRDRYWHPDPAVMNRQMAAEPNLPFLDVLKPITLRNNRWRCDHGWDVDLDDGSSRYRIYNNLFLNGGLKLREGYGRHVWNNITVNNSLHPHVWLKNSGDVATNNLWMGAYRPAVMPGGSEKWGELVDYNLFATSERDRRQFQPNGCDTHSIVADPLFLDPARGDYRVSSQSPALRIGFQNFPMDNFGVQKPELKTLAKSPKLPTVRVRIDLTPTESSTVATYQWLGATVKSLEGEEFSAYGVSHDEGGIAVLKVSEDSNAARMGLHAGDLIQSVDGHPTRTLLELKSIMEDRAAPDLHEIKLVRNQSPLLITLKAGSPPK